MTHVTEEIGLAIVGCGTVGRIRAMIAKEYPWVGWIGLCDVDEELGQGLAEDCEADFITTTWRSFLTGPR